MTEIATTELINVARSKAELVKVIKIVLMWSEDDSVNYIPPCTFIFSNIIGASVAPLNILITERYSSKVECCWLS